MPNDPLISCVESIHGSGRKFVLAATGGGTSAIAALLQRPGGSRSMLEAVAPYSPAALRQFLGGEPDQACSEATARAMAMAAWTRARKLAPDDDSAQLVGVACTASLATDRPKRGDHRIHVAVQTSICTHSYSVTFAGKERSRADEEQLAAQLTIFALAKRCGADVDAFRSQLQDALQADESIVERGAVAEPAWGELVSGARHWTPTPHGPRG